MKALKEYSEAQDVQMATEMSTNEKSVSNQTSDDVSNPLPNSDLKPQKSVVNEPVFKVPSSEGVRKKRPTSVLPKAPMIAAADSDSPPAPKRLCHTSVQSKVPMAVATDADSLPAPKHLCENKVSPQLSSLNISCSDKTGQYQPVSSPLLKSLSATSTPQGQTSPESIMEPSQFNAPVSESPMCTNPSQENTDPPNEQSLQGPVAESLPIPVPTLHEEKPARAQFGEKQSSTACYALLSKEARKASFDKRRRLGIAAALAEEKEQSSADGSESEVDDSDDSSDSEDESSDEECDDPPDVKIDGKE